MVVSRFVVVSRESECTRASWFLSRRSDDVQLDSMAFSFRAVFFNKYVLLTMIVIFMVEIQIWLNRGMASMSIERRDEMDLPEIWVCPPDPNAWVRIESCAFQRGGKTQRCASKDDVDYVPVGGNSRLVCANIATVEKYDLEPNALLSYRLPHAHTFV